MNERKEIICADEEFMTVSEVSASMNVSQSTVVRAIRELFPTLMVSGVQTLLDEVKVTALHEHIMCNRQLVNPAELTTDIQMSELTAKVLAYHIEKANLYKKEKDIAEDQVKKLVHDFNKLYTTTEIAKELNLKSAQALNAQLHRDRIQFNQNNTWVLYSDYSDKGYTSIKESILDNGKIVYDRLWTGTGRQFILDLYTVGLK